MSRPESSVGRRHACRRRFSSAVSKGARVSAEARTMDGKNKSYFTVGLPLGPRKSQKNRSRNGLATVTVTLPQRHEEVGRNIRLI